MTPILSPNTQAILLLTAPLISGRAVSSSELLSPGEYKRLAKHLLAIKHQPSDLLAPGIDELLRDCHLIIDEQRLKRLIGRGFLLSQAIERWQARAIWVVSRADADYPRRLKIRLREDAPAVLYGCGDINLLETGGLAVVGSRHVDEVLVDYTMAIGKLSARAKQTIVSGGAKGIDQAAMRGALESGGNVCGVLADSLEKATMNRENRNLLLEGQLVLVSPYDPSAGFNVGHAMGRNKLIYALADASLVVSSDLKKGGTWAGALEQLDKYKFVPVYVRTTGVSSEGLDALRKKGAFPWPEPQDKEAFSALFDVVTPIASVPSNVDLSLFSNETSPNAEQTSDAMPETPLASEAEPEHLLVPAPLELLENIPEPSLLLINAGDDVVMSQESETKLNHPKVVVSHELAPADALFSAVREIILQLLKQVMKDTEIAVALDVSNPQAKVWLQRLVDEGAIEKQKKPAGYIVKQSGLF